MPLFCTRILSNYIKTRLNGHVLIRHKLQHFSPVKQLSWLTVLSPGVVAEFLRIALCLETLSVGRLLEHQFVSSTT